ncbi:MAG: hypothetical protein J7J10_03620 [Deltaproteobacteria bacterium]|nr:hypothetical protein [Deltaproteobacteria bacterium]
MDEQMRPSHEDDEIDLYEYYKVVAKRKWLILIITVLCAVAAFLISSFLPKVYKVSCVVRLGVWNILPDGKVLYIDTPQNVVGMVKNDVFSSKIMETFQLKAPPKFKAEIEKGTQLINISYETDKPEEGKAIVDKLIDLIKNRYGNRIKAKKDNLEKRLDILQRRKNTISLALKTARENTENLTKEREGLLKEKKRSSLSVILYTTTIQQNIAYVNGLYSQLKWTQDETENLKFMKNSIEGVKVVQTAKVSQYPVKPKKKLNTVIALVVGLFFSIFLAFFLEWLEKAKKQKAER